ncbi:MAG TPA: hypothetical protein PLU88_11590 [Armatimonadota bacterium]|nr:hypothetical protein [Armatimonadota bacterium]HPP75755.1 hypothetical protein [Armatimonadota bacterium]
MRITCFTILLVLVVLCAASVQAQEINWSSVNACGGLTSSGAYNLSSSVGQVAAGFTYCTEKLHWVGFWAGDMPIPAVRQSVKDVKSLPDGAYVSIPAKIATSGFDPAARLEDRFSGFFYIEEPDRYSGIRISAPNWPIAGLSRGSVVNVIGTMDTTSSGERQLVASVVTITDTEKPLGPLGMNNRSLGGSDLGYPPLGQCGVTSGTGLNNIGLLVKSWGMITYKDPSGNYILITDGTGESIKVDTTGLSGVPSKGYLSVIGISTLYEDSPLILPRSNTDIEPR